MAEEEPEGTRPREEVEGKGSDPMIFPLGGGDI
jgi:hypothetical protein